MELVEPAVVRVSTATTVAAFKRLVASRCACNDTARVHLYPVVNGDLSLDEAGDDDAGGAAELPVPAGRTFHVYISDLNNHRVSSAASALAAPSAAASAPAATPAAASAASSPTPRPTIVRPTAIDEAYTIVSPIGTRSVDWPSSPVATGEC